MEVQTRETPEIETEDLSLSHQKACSNCIHVKTCGAFEAFSGVLNEMEKKYDYVKKPFPAESLAVTCTEFVNVLDLARKQEEETHEEKIL